MNFSQNNLINILRLKMNHNLFLSKENMNSENEESDDFDLEGTVKARQIKNHSGVKSINWLPRIDLGEVAGVDTDEDGNIWVFHR